MLLKSTLARTQVRVRALHPFADLVGHLGQPLIVVPSLVDVPVAGEDPELERLGLDVCCVVRARELGGQAPSCGGGDRGLLDEVTNFLLRVRPLLDSQQGRLQLAHGKTQVGRVALQEQRRLEPRLGDVVLHSALEPADPVPLGVRDSRQPLHRAARVRVQRVAMHALGDGDALRRARRTALARWHRVPRRRCALRRRHRGHEPEDALLDVVARHAVLAAGHHACEGLPRRWSLTLACFSAT
mmetsp:Transcript_21311/g.72174  ORF Transcript_21311/g.72174 Transcript_21311/m.72174 type:complete len:242 (-) Transcript_21311:37-762(-)